LDPDNVKPGLLVGERTNIGGKLQKITTNYNLKIPLVEIGLIDES
jgi:hypothetical protein